MLIAICLIILGYMIVGKDVKPWVEKLKSVEWMRPLRSGSGRIMKFQKVDISNNMYE